MEEEEKGEEGGEEEQGEEQAHRHAPLLAPDLGSRIFVPEKRTAVAAWLVDSPNLLVFPSAPMKTV